MIGEIGGNGVEQNLMSSCFIYAATKLARMTNLTAHYILFSV